MIEIYLKKNRRAFQSANMTEKLKNKYILLNHKGNICSVPNHKKKH